MSDHPISTPDPLAQALHESIVGIFLGRTHVDQIHVDESGGMTRSTFTLESALENRIGQMVRNGDYDDMLRQALAHIDPQVIADAVAANLAKQIMKDLNGRHRYSSDRTWIQEEIHAITVAAITAAVKGDEELTDTLRAKVGMATDRDDIAITVNLIPKES